MKNQITTAVKCTIISATALSLALTSCSDEDSESHNTAQNAVISQAEVQALQNSCQGSYQDFSLKNYKLFFEYVCDKDSTFKLVTMATKDSATAAKITSADVTLDNAISSRAGTYDDRQIEVAEGKWHAFIDNRNGTKVQGIVWNITGADNVCYTDTLYLDKDLSGYTLARADHKGLINMLVNGRVTSRGAFDWIFDAANAIKDFFTDTLPDWCFNVGTAIYEWVPRLAEGIYNTLTGDVQKFYSDPNNFMGNSHLDNWMSRLNDNTPLYQVSMPGTHDSFSYLSFWSAMVATTQGLTISGQWNTGVRCFDVRIDANKDTQGDMRVCHGVITYDMSLTDALKEIKNMLDTHPTETVIVTLKTDSDDDTPAKFNHINQLAKQVFGDKIFNWDGKSLKDITVGNTRNKVVLISRLHYDSNNMNYEYALEWPTTRNDSLQYKGKNICSFAEQDDYCPAKMETDGHYLDKKKQEFNEFMTKNINPNGFIMNSTSGYCGNVASVNYFKTANNVAPYAERLIKQLPSGNSVGIIRLDYAGADAYDGSCHTNTKTIAETIINNNFK